MKSKYNKINPLVVLAVLFGIFYGCNEYNTIGLEVLPSGDLLQIKNKMIKDDISSFTHKIDSVSSDEARQSLIGSFNDSLFGVTTANFATNYRLSWYPDFGDFNPKPDSLVLNIYFKTIYGDTITPQHFKVYELKSRIDREDSFYSDEDLKSLANSELVGEVIFTPKVKIDTTSKDSLTRSVSIRLKNSLAEKLFYADSLLHMVSVDAFQNYFKGLYIESEKISSQGGSILSLESVLLSNPRDYTKKVNSIGTSLALYYHNDSTAADSALVMPYASSLFGARVNQFVHDYSGAPFFHNLNSTTNEDSLIYIQPTGGLKSKIFIENLATWKDSISIVGLDTFFYGINKAELIFQIDTLASQVHRFLPPEQLLFLADSVGISKLPYDYNFSPAFYGGGLREDYTYHFNITQHLQEIIKGKIDNLGFSLVSAYKNEQANRVVLKGAKSTTGIKLSITYTKPQY